jgi:hypothetical protein
LRKLIIISFLLLSNILIGQDEVLDRSKWEQLKKEMTYSKSSGNTTSNDKNEAGKESRLTESEQSQSSGRILNLGPVMVVVVIILFIVLIVALLYVLIGSSLFSNSPSNIHIKGGLNIEMLDEDLDKSDLEKWLERALDEKSYHLAIRIYFLIALKELELKGLIRYQKEKTNWQYIQELKDHQLQFPFRSLVLEYDNVWYGEKVYEEEDLLQKIKHFKDFDSLIKQDSK